MEVKKGDCKQPCLSGSPLRVKWTGMLCPGVDVEVTTVMTESCPHRKSELLNVTVFFLIFANQIATFIVITLCTVIFDFI